MGHVPLVPPVSYFSVRSSMFDLDVLQDICDLESLQSIGWKSKLRYNLTMIANRNGMLLHFDFDTVNARIENDLRFSVR